MSKDEALTYASYLQLDKVLAAQSPRSKGPSGEPEHDEMLFIVIHQVFELWFKQLLHELDFLCDRIRSGELTPAFHTLKRVRNILKVMVSQIDVLETMTPLEFGAFRNRLERASGLQSLQFRELEFVLGKKRPEVLDRYEEGEGRERLLHRLSAPTLWDAVLVFLADRGYLIPAVILERDFSETATTNDEVVAVLERVYKEDNAAAELCELLTDVDEGLQEWRYRHVKMVQRTIGTRGGTGGSSGAEYLMGTLNDPVFPDLWRVRTRL